MQLETWLDEVAATSPLQAELLGVLAARVRANERWRWLEVGCSLAARRGDELSDIDAGAGYTDTGERSLVEFAADLVREVGPVHDVLVHVMDGMPEGVVRAAAEYTTGVQLDLVVMPAALRKGLPDSSVAVVDKDGRLASSSRPARADPPSPAVAREWVMLGWWAMSDAIKYLRRGSLFEAAERIGEVRSLTLRLHATGRHVPYPGFGLTSLLDYPPFELPEELATAYPQPDRRSLEQALVVMVDLHERAAAAASVAIDADLTTSWSSVTKQRLQALLSENGAR